MNGIHGVNLLNGFKEGGESDVFYGPMLTSKRCKLGINSELIANADPVKEFRWWWVQFNSRSSLSSHKLPVNHMTNFSNYGIGTNISASRGKVATHDIGKMEHPTIYEMTMDILVEKTERVFHAQ